MNSQRGGFFLGMIVGLLIGLALALGVALYITKVPLPFIDKVPQRTAEQDAAEAEKNKNWDPNSPLYGKNPAKPHPVQVEAPVASDAAASGVAPSVVETPVAPTAPPAPVASAASSAKEAKAAAKAASAAASTARNPAAILSGEAVSTNPASDSLSYQVQAGAYGSQAEAEAQRAKLAMMGLEPRIQEREVNGRTMYRVRIGPFAQREQADEVRVKLQAAGVESALVRVQK
ncbi:MAG TPA: SPOR domain-containing protein [Aquabacterium sp.]|uniref:SPOR domain-containing protein n=1 Tax=Aquabacterium sp. TaxID=1872578 RepID=UPI002E2EDA1B|nr:SPOR domain-containing protein [Aquabacterium sp.]HEX5357183.1 SPOR domain-containing protein [Aquabacterium sp.]